MDDDEFRVLVPGGELVGRARGTGTPVLLLHGGPCIGYEYLEDLLPELEGDLRVAWFQQRGLAPSTAEGPFTMQQAVADVVAVLDHLGWARAAVVGHSYGGHLVAHLVADVPDRLLVAVAVDPLGAIGDGGEAEFGAEFLERVSPESRDRLVEYAQRQEDGEVLSDRDQLEELRLYWPGYFADPSAAPPMPPTRLSSTNSVSQFESARASMASMPGRLVGAAVPTVFVHGGSSPMPVSASADTAAAMGPAASVVVVDGAGHFVWYERPGAVRQALEELLAAGRAS